MKTTIEVQRWNYDRSEYQPVPLNRVRYNGEIALISGKIRILVNQEVIYLRQEGKEEKRRLQESTDLNSNGER